MVSKKECSFQYYDGNEVVYDSDLITIEEAKSLFNKYYENMVQRSRKGWQIEVAIWINMEDNCDYHTTYIHLCYPEVENGRLVTKHPTYYPPFDNVETEPPTEKEGE